MPDNNPYVGPASFTKDDKGKFFGRDDEARELSYLLIARRAVLLYAQSGAGKTSLLQAKLIPDFEESGEMYVFPILRVSGSAEDGNVYVANALARLSVTASTLTEALAPFFPQARAGEEQVPRLLIFDQFEELFTFRPELTDQRREFFEQLRNCLAEYPKLGLLLSMREDYLADMDSFSGYLPDRLRSRMRMERLSGEQAEDAIARPAKDAGKPFEEGVARRLAGDLRRVQAARKPSGTSAAGTHALGKYVEPVQLQIVCQRLWSELMKLEEKSKVKAPAITMEHVDTLARVDDALTGFYQDALAAALKKAPTLTERELRTWFGEQLITSAKTRGMVFEGEVEAGSFQDAVQVLLAKYVLRTDLRPSGTWYELAHDRLVDPILADNLAWRNQNMSPFQQEAEAWEANKRSEDRLLRGEALRQAENWDRTHALSPAEEAFLKSSQEAEQRRLDAKERLRQAAERQAKDARTARIFKWGSVALAVLLVGALGALLYAKSAAQRAEDNAKDLAEALAEFDLAKVEGLWDDGEPAKALAYLARAFEGQPENAKPKVAEYLFNKNLIVPSFERDHKSKVERMVFSSDGNWMITMSKASSQVWNANTGDPVGRPFAGSINGVLSPDGKLAVLFDSKNMSVFDVTSGAKRWGDRGPAESFDQVALDAKHIFTGPTEPRVWDIGTGNATPVGFERGVVYTAFSPGPNAVLAMQKYAPLFWNPMVRNSKVTFPESFSENGCASGQPSTPAALNHNGNMAAFVAGKNVYVWNTGSVGTVPTLNKMIEEPCSTGFALTPRGERVVVIGESGFGLWDLRTREPDPIPPVKDQAGPFVFQSGAPVFAEIDKFEKDGEPLEGALVVRKVDTGAAVARALLGKDGSNWALSADGRKLATTAKDSRFAVWDVPSSPGQPQLPNQFSAAEIQALADLARAAGGITLARGSSKAEPVDRLDLYGKLAARPGLDPLVSTAIKRFQSKR